MKIERRRERGKGDPKKTISQLVSETRGRGKRTNGDPQEFSLAHMIKTCSSRRSNIFLCDVVIIVLNGE